MGHEHSLTMADLRHISPDIYVTIKKMQQIVKKRDEILSNSDLTEEEQAEQVNIKFTQT